MSEVEPHRLAKNAVMAAAYFTGTALGLAIIWGALKLCGWESVMTPWFFVAAWCTDSAIRGWKSADA